jgi:peptidase E
MQLTRNISVFRLVTVPLDEVLAHHGEYEALRFVEYEILPHLNRFEPSFVETVRRYSERIAHDVVALADGAALLHTSRNDCRCVGQAIRFRNGVTAALEASA